MEKSVSTSYIHEFLDDLNQELASTRQFFFVSPRSPCRFPFQCIHGDHECVLFQTGHHSGYKCKGLPCCVGLAYAPKDLPWIKSLSHRKDRQRM